ncbi:MAG TPA: dienelactone hydrolase family protein [Candidatus Acidoferrales bacterium]|nr:dienelactone hydrolase family protein [Candidatus Acidoferrales bacterium]
MKGVIVFVCVVFVSLADAAEIKTSIVQYVSGSDTVSAYLAQPADAGKHPALIVIHEWWGLTDWMKQDARDFAARGYVALAIDLYRGALASTPQDAYKLLVSVPKERGAMDLKAAFEYLASIENVNTAKIGVIGWCMGGSYSFEAATLLPKLAACVIDYGNVDTTAAAVGQINCPVLCNFAELDKTYTPKMGEAFKKAMQSAGKKIEFHVYPGVNHAFMNPNNPSVYNETQTAEAWENIFAFLNANLK